MTDESGFRRRLVTVAVRDYPSEGEAFRTGIDDQVSVLAQWLLDNARLGPRSFTHEALNPHNEDCISDFVRQQGLRVLGPADVVVLYVTGHGIAGGSGFHYLLLGNSDDGEPSTGYRTSQLLTAVLATEAEHVLVLVDSCNAGALDAEWALLRKDLPAARRKLATLAVLASADFDEKPRIGEFASLLRLVHERLCGPAQIAGPYLSFVELTAEIGAVLKEHPALGEPTLVWLPAASLLSQAPSMCLPNPGFTPPSDLVEQSRRQVAVTRPELHDYWLGRAAGRVAPNDPGWYFSGRSELMAAVVSFLRAGPGALVITGAAGTGKSAILARTVTLSDATFLERNADLVHGIDPEAMPPPNSIDAAILARNKDCDQVSAELLEALGGDASSPDATGQRPIDQVIAHLAAGATPRTVVIDGVDEALNPGQLIADVLGPLGRLRASGGARLVRLLVGLRSVLPQNDDARDPGQGLLDLLGRAVSPQLLEVLRTDVQPAVTADIEVYLGSLIRVAGPYVGAAAKGEPVVKLVAEKVTPSFLDARLVGQRLREAKQRQDLQEPRWLATLSDGTLSLLRADLADVAIALGQPVEGLLAVLRATAFALGRGLPWSDVWPAVAAAVLGRPLPHADLVIASVLKSRLSGYLAQDVEDGRVVHRPSHERLAEKLRDAEDSLSTGGDQ